MTHQQQQTGCGAIVASLLGCLFFGMASAGSKPWARNLRNIHTPAAPVVHAPSSPASASRATSGRDSSIINGLGRHAGRGSRLDELNAQETAFTPPPTLPPIESFTLITDPRADETLFLVRQLDVLLSTVALSSGDPVELASSVRELRQTLASDIDAIREAQLDPLLPAMYQVAEEDAQALADFLIDVGLLERGYTAAADAKNRIATFRTAESAARTAGTLAASGADPWTVGAGALIQVAVDATVHAAEAEKLKARRQAELQRRVDALTTESAGRTARLRSLARELAERSGWSATEAGFQENDPRTTRLVAACDGGDYVAAEAILTELLAARPRDPFLQYALGSVYHDAAAAYMETAPERASAAFQQAAACFDRGAELTPRGARYDSLRVEFLIYSAACWSREAYGSNTLRTRPVALCDAALKLDPQDASGAIRSERAEALARSGRSADALRSYDALLPLLGRTGETVYKLAYYRSLAGDAAGSLEALREARRLGYTDVRHVNRDADLAALRTQFPQEFAELVKPKWSWKIDFGVFQNDVLVNNRSDFDITHAVLEVTWVPTAGDKRTELLWVGCIPAGATHRFAAALDGCIVSQTDNTATTAKLYCWESLPAAPSLRTYSSPTVMFATRLVGGSNSAGPTGAKLRLNHISAEASRIEVESAGVTTSFTATNADVARGHVGHETCRLFFGSDRIYGWIKNAGSSDLVVISFGSAAP